MLPASDAYPLLPGEFLTWKLSIPASALPAVRKGTSYTLRIRLAATLASGAAADAPTLAALETELVLRAD